MEEGETVRVIPIATMPRSVEAIAKTSLPPLYRRTLVRDLRIE
jgi:hypothetical protein